MFKLYRVNIYAGTRLLKTVFEVAETPEGAVLRAKTRPENAIFVTRGDQFTPGVINLPGYDSFYIDQDKDFYPNSYGSVNGLCIERDMFYRLYDALYMEDYEGLKEMFVVLANAIRENEMVQQINL